MLVCTLRRYHSLGKPTRCTVRGCKPSRSGFVETLWKSTKLRVRQKFQKRVSGRLASLTQNFTSFHLVVSKIAKDCSPELYERILVPALGAGFVIFSIINKIVWAPKIWKLVCRWTLPSYRSLPKKLCPWRPLCWKKSIWPDIDFWRNRTADPVFCLKNPKKLSNPIVLSLSFPLMPKKWGVRSGPTSPFGWMTQRGSVKLQFDCKPFQ